MKGKISKHGQLFIERAGCMKAQTCIHATSESLLHTKTMRGCLSCVCGARHRTGKTSGKTLRGHRDDIFRRVHRRKGGAMIEFVCGVFIGMILMTAIRLVADTWFLD